MNRRQFLLTTAAAAPLLAKPKYAPTIAGGAYVWTQYLGRQNKKLSDGLEEIFTGFREAGYREVELMSSFFSPELADRTRSLLDKNRLRLPVVYNGGRMHTVEDGERTITGTIALAGMVKSLGVNAISFNCDPKPKKERKTDEELQVELSNLKNLASQLHGRGMELWLHEHDPEMADGAREWRYLLNGSDPKTTLICLDVHWIQRGGQDPMTIVKEAGKRIGGLHVRNSNNGVWQEDFGPGDLDYAAVAAYLKSIDFAGPITVELAWDKETPITRTIVEDLRRGLQYAESVFGVRA
jgi:inosose dehydratase